MPRRYQKPEGTVVRDERDEFCGSTCVVIFLAGCTGFTSALGRFEFKTEGWQDEQPSSLEYESRTYE